MKIAIDILGHHIEFSIDHPAEAAESEREGAADTHVERADPWMPTLGFGPNQPREGRAP